MFVLARHEEHGVTIEALETSHRIGGNYLVGMSDVGHAVRVQDGRGIKNGVCSEVTPRNLPYFGNKTTIRDAYMS